MSRVVAGNRNSHQLAQTRSSDESTPGKAHRTQGWQKFADAAKRLLGLTRDAAIAQRVSDAVPSDASQSIRKEVSTARSSNVMDSLEAAFAAAAPEGKSKPMRDAVRLAYRESLNETKFAGAEQSKGKKYEMTISTLDSKLTKLLSNSSVSSDDLKYIEESLPHFENKLPPAIRESLKSALQAHRPTTESLSEQSSLAPLATQALRSPANPGRNAESERISRTALLPVKKTLSSEQAKLRSQFEGKLRQSLQGTTTFAVEKVVVTAGTIVRELMLDSQLTREKFSQKFEEATKKNFQKNTEIQQFQMLLYAQHAYDVVIEANLPQ